MAGTKGAGSEGSSSSGPRLPGGKHLPLVCGDVGYRNRFQRFRWPYLSGNFCRAHLRGARAAPQPGAFKPILQPLSSEARPSLLSLVRLSLTGLVPLAPAQARIFLTREIVMKSISTRCVFVFLFLAILMPSGSLIHAEIFGRIEGIVHDPQHRPVAGASVKLQAVTSALSQTAQTDGNGEFSFSAVPLGDYRISVTQTGFENLAQTVTVVSGSSPVLHFQLAIAAVSNCCCGTCAGYVDAASTCATSVSG